MSQCNACGASLRFDIKLQKMLCPYCNTTYDPYSVKGSTAKEAKYYASTIYTCKQCGAELGSTETSAAEFCSFCGSPVVLESRLSQLERPKYIIPFKKTKEDSVEAFREHLGRSFFVPRDFKNCELDRFRGIYMPCWSYNVSQENEECKLEVQASFDDEGSYKSYTVKANVNASYEGFSHEASKQFADQISECLEPYDYKKRVDFAPSFLSGFFSDIKDVDPSQYKEDAIAFANDHTYEKYIERIKAPEILDKHLSNDAKTTLFNTHIQSVDSTLVPVWFMSYKRGSRICYASVNGETGKVVTDLPLALGKLLLLALCLAAPLFFLLNAFVSMRASTLVVFAITMIALTAQLYVKQLERIRKREANIYFHKAEREKTKSKAKKSSKGKFHLFDFILDAVFFIMDYFFPILLCVLIIPAVLYGLFINRVTVLYYIASVFAVIIPISGLVRFRRRDLHMHPWGFLSLLITALICISVYYQDPVSDVYFYGAALSALAAITFTLINLCRSLNMLTTRPLPQLDRRGGDEYAR